MPVFKARRLVRVPADTAFVVAADVARYHEFLPLVENSAIIGEVQSKGGVQTFRASLAAGYKKFGLQEQFVSEVSCDGASRRVTATCNERPFRHMRTVWTIAESGPHAEVNIEINYVMRNPLIQAALGGVMEVAVSRIMAAFEGRAKEVYEATSRSS